MQTTVNTAKTTGVKRTKVARSQHLSNDGKWRYFPKVPNLLQYVSTGTYFARVKIKGKTIRQSLETDVFTTAKLKLPDKLKGFHKPQPVAGTWC